MKILLFIIIIVFLCGHISAQNSDSLITDSTPLAAIVLYEAGMGVLWTAGTYLGSAMLIGSVFEADGLGDVLAAAFITASLAATLGGSYGVHFIDKKYNKNSSYLLAVAGAFVGYGVSFLLLSRDSDKPITGAEAVTAGIAPLVFSIMTVNLINYESIDNSIDASYSPSIINNEVQHNLNFRIEL